MKLFIIAGESSGDKLGGALMESLRSLRPDIRFTGVGGRLMQAQGLESLFPMQELSVMGLAEVLPRLRSLFARRDQTVAAILAEQPDAIVTIDSPDFCLRVLKKVKAAQNIPAIHYVAPSVWAWRPKRAVRMAGLVDHVLAVLPIEPPLMRAAGVSCDFVGHPIVSEPLPSTLEVEEFKTAFPARGLRLCLLPGSRLGEVRRLAPVFSDVLDEMRDEIDRVILPAAAGVADALREISWPVPVDVLDPRDTTAQAAEHRKRIAFRACDIALAASGTVALELARAGTPMVVAYRLSPLTAAIMRRMMLTKYVSLPNILLQQAVVPELLQEQCRAGNIVSALRALSAASSLQTQSFSEVLKQLGEGDTPPGLRAARSVLSCLER